jgi:thioredoxin-related protein
MKKIFYLLIYFSIYTNAQEHKGITFETTLSWEQAKAKAKAENKYIFVDCYATWCAPCKKMDKDVFSAESVGDYMNSRFISVKVQMDSTTKDNAEVRQWYADAHIIRQDYKVVALPTYLFFAPDGQITHRGQGVKDIQGFITLADDAKDPEKGFYTQVRNNLQGKKNYETMPALAMSAQQFFEPDIASKMVRDYIEYLNKMDDDQVLNNMSREFLALFSSMINSKDKIFKLCFQLPGKADAAMDVAGFSNNFVSYIITKEEINPLTDAAKESGTEPDWTKIEKSIQEKYNPDYAFRCVINKQIGWYYKNDWPKTVEYTVKKLETFGLDTLGGFIGTYHMLTMLYNHSDDKQVLTKAIGWMEAIERNIDPKIKSGLMDTYAGLLYKIGRTKEGIDLQEKYVQSLPVEYIYYKEEVEILEKMKKGEKTWKDN